MTTSRKPLSTGFILIVLGLACLAALVLIPATEPPSQTEAEAIILKAIEEQSQGLVRLVSFDKTDDRPSVERGRKVHRVMFQGEIEFTEDCLWGTKWDDFWWGKFTASKLPAGGVPQEMTYSVRPVKQGDRIRFTGAILFERGNGKWTGHIDRDWCEIL